MFLEDAAFGCAGRRRELGLGLERVARLAGFGIVVDPSGAVVGVPGVGVFDPRAIPRVQYRS